MNALLLQWKQHCPRCITGIASQVSSYKAYGTAVDYAIHLKIPYAFTFEVYGTTQRSCFNMFNPKNLINYQQILNQWVQILK